MMTKKNDNNRFQIEFNCLDDLVPKDHLVRKIDRAINFDFIYDEVKDLYSAVGAPSIDPVVLIKIVMIQYLFGIQSMKKYLISQLSAKTMKEDLKIQICLIEFSLRY